MTDQELQTAIDRARAWISTQLDYKTTPSSDLKDATISHIKALQKIQAARAEAVVVLGSTEPKAGITAVAGACAMCHGSGLTVAGYTCPCKNITMFGGSHG